MSTIELERYNDTTSGDLVVAVTFEGERYERRIGPRASTREVEIARSWIRYRDVLRRPEAVERTGPIWPAPHYCIAIEALFPKLIGRLPR